MSSPIQPSNGEYSFYVPPQTTGETIHKNLRGIQQLNDRISSILKKINSNSTAVEKEEAGNDIHYYGNLKCYFELENAVLQKGFNTP